MPLFLVDFGAWLSQPSADFAREISAESAENKGFRARSDYSLLPILEELKIRDEAAKNNDFSNEIFNLAVQFASAELIVIAAPYWDLSFPAVVKNYFEKITVNGLTFAYGKNGIPYGKCNAKKLIYVTTSGGPIINNFGYEYVKALAVNFYGIGECACVKAEGLDIYGADVADIMEKAKKSFK